MRAFFVCNTLKKSPRKKFDCNCYFKKKKKKPTSLLLNVVF